MASNTAGWALRADSTSSGKIFSPPELMHCEPRPEEADGAVLLEDGLVAGQGVPHPGGPGDEGGGRLLGVLVVLERDVAAAGQPALARPGATSLNSGSSTTVSRAALTVGPPPLFWVSPLATIRMPLEPVSDEPMASMIIRFGNSSRYWSFTVGEKIAAVEASTNIDDRSSASGPPSSSSASIIGRAMASPVMATLLIALALDRAPHLVRDRTC